MGNLTANNGSFPQQRVERWRSSLLMLSPSFLHLPQALNKAVSCIHICTETKPGEYEGVCLNPKNIPPDDLDDVILGRMMEEAIVYY